jgi:hypothetical protein
VIRPSIDYNDSPAKGFAGTLARLSLGTWVGSDKGPNAGSTPAGRATVIEQADLEKKNVD